MRITLVAGARPNFMKIAPIIDAIKIKQNEGENIQYRLIHTGQHYNKELSETFFDQLKIPQPDANLEVGSGSHAVQTANIMIKFEQELLQHPTDLVLVVGDVNSTMAATLVAKKMDIPVAHVEAGLRSYDLKMPEEINRMVTDSIADYFLTTTQEAGQNLKRTGITDNKIFFVGNTMIDSLVKNINNIKIPEVWEKNNFKANEYLLLTLHRPSNVDDSENLNFMLKTICRIAKNYKVIFPVHPRTIAKLENPENLPANLIISSPLGYLQFIYLMKNSLAVVTDSGGIQEETTYLKVPCLTLRENTERPETITIGTNELIGHDMEMLEKCLNKIFDGKWKEGSIPELWDGKSGERITDFLLNNFIKDKEMY